MAAVNYTPELVQEIREGLKEEVSKLDPSCYDEQEYQRFLSDDSYFVRYIKRKRGDVPATIPFLIGVLKWRQSFGISQLTETSFPREFYDIGGIHVHGEDKDGHVLLHIRISLFQKLAEILDLLKKFTIFLMLKADSEATAKGPGHGWVLIFDCTGAGIANADIEMANFLNSSLKNYFPSGQMYVLGHNLPWLLNAVKNIIFAMLPANVKRRIKFSTDKTITDFISKDQLPGYMSGTSTQVYPYIPKGAMSTSEMVKEGILNLSPEEESRVHKYYEKLYSDLKRSRPVSSPDSSNNVPSPIDKHSSSFDHKSEVITAK